MTAPVADATTTATGPAASSDTATADTGRTSASTSDSTSPPEVTVPRPTPQRPSRRSGADDVRVGGQENQQAEQDSSTAEETADERQRDNSRVAPGDDWTIDDLPVGARKLISDLRKEAGDHRVKANSAEKKATATAAKLEQFLEGFAKVMGLQEDASPQPPDPEKLTAELQAAQKQHREALIRLAIHEAAAVHDADPRALTDSVRFLNTVNKLDPGAEDFDAQISNAVASAVTDNPLFRVARQAPAPAAAPSGGQFAGGPGGSTDPEAMSIDDFRKTLTKRRPN